MDRKPTLSDFGEKSTNTKSTLSFIGIGLENQILGKYFLHDQV